MTNKDAIYILSGLKRSLNEYCGLNNNGQKAFDMAISALQAQELKTRRKTLVNVNKGQDAYSVIGNYISNHITAIEDMIAVIRIDGCITNELYMVDMETDGYFYWKSDWWEGEEDVALIDFFPVSEAERPQEVNNSKGTR